MDKKAVIPTWLLELATQMYAPSKKPFHTS